MVLIFTTYFKDEALLERKKLYNELKISFAFFTELLFFQQFYK